VAVIGCFCVDLQGVPLIGGQLPAIYDFNHSVPLQNGNIFLSKMVDQNYKMSNIFISYF
jgi:hypothetical protein